MTVVSNAGPMIALGRLGQLGLLLKLYGRILVPREVYVEVVVNGLRLGAPEARAVEFLVQEGQIQVIAINTPAETPAWAGSIDIGEIEAIRLAQQRGAEWVLIDDAHARKAARRAGVRPKRTVGVLLAGFREDYLSLQELDLLLRTIKSMPELWISERLCEETLALARREAERRPRP